MGLADHYALLIRGTYLLMGIPTLLVVISAFISTKHFAGPLGSPLKKIAAGTIMDTIVLMTYLSIEKGLQGALSEGEVRLFFLICGLLASSLLTLGYVELYKFSRHF